jgi:transposase
MKGQKMAKVKSKPAVNNRAVYTAEFKREAVRLALDPNGPIQKQTAENLGVSYGTLKNWIKEFRDDPQQAFPGHGKLKPQDEELHKLKIDLRNALEERDILKKALAFFSRTTK